MHAFEWVDAKSVEHAVEVLAQSTNDKPVIAKAGGMDVLDLTKEGLLQPSRMLNLRSLPGLDGILFDARKGLELGALATMARVGQHKDILARFPALAEAVNHAATPQVRNSSTIGGNLLQRPRCWYFRNETVRSLPGDLNERVRNGQNQFHAIFDNQKTAMVHASTPATALVAYGASVELTGPGGKVRTVPVSELLLPPDPRRDRDTVVGRDELLTRVKIPPLPSGTRAAYHKQGERESYDWPLCDVAVVLHLDGKVVRRASIVMGWVAPTPRRATAAEALLVGKTVNEELARAVARAAVQGATPLSRNAYKVPLLEAVVRRTILAAA